MKSGEKIKRLLIIGDILYGNSYSMPVIPTDFNSPNQKALQNEFNKAKEKFEIKRGNKNENNTL